MATPVFFRADRVIARSVSRGVPADLFRVNLPTPPQAESEGSMREPRVGITERNIGELYGVPRFRVDYVGNGEQASHEVYKSRSDETFVAFTFVDGRANLTEFENIGPMSGDVSFQGL